MGYRPITSLSEIDDAKQNAKAIFYTCFLLAPAPFIFCIINQCGLSFISTIYIGYAIFGCFILSMLFMALNGGIFYFNLKESDDVDSDFEISYLTSSKPFVNSDFLAVSVYIKNFNSLIKISFDPHSQKLSDMKHARVIGKTYRNMFIKVILVENISIKK